MVPDLVVRSTRVIAGGAVRPASVHIRGGVIAAIAGHGEAPPGCPLVDAGSAVVMPGWSTRTSISTSPDARSGRALPPRPAPRPPAA